MDLIVITTEEEIRRSVSMTNDEWLVLSQCVESFSEHYRAQQSKVIATYVTRNQLDQAVIEASKMNALLQKLDGIQASLV